MDKLKNTFYFCTQDYHVIFAKKLIKYGFIPKGFLKNTFNQELLKTTFPSVKTFQYYQFLKSNLNYKQSYKNLTPVNVLKSMNTHFHEYSKILLRQDTFIPTLSLFNSLDLFNLNIQYWYNYFTHNKIKLAVFEEEPHKSNTFLAYQLCLIMKIQTYMPLRTIGVLGIIPTSNYEERLNDNNLKKLFKSKAPVKNNKNFLNYISDLSNDYKRAQKIHLWNQLNDIQEKKVFSFKIKISKNRLKNAKNYSSDFKTFFSKLENSNENYLNYLINKIYKLIYIKKLKKNYILQSKKLVLSKYTKKYIYFPLQMQPEKSTLPLGSPFDNTLYTLQLLIKNTPSNVKIFVKEHPTHFIYWRNTTNLMWRKIKFYNQISNLSKRIILLDYKTNPFDLIDNSLFVASVGGTVCWESAVRGKRAMNFSKIWFDNCHGISLIECEKDIKDFVNKRIYEKKIRKKSVVNFAEQIFNLGYNCAHGNPEELKNLKISPEENAESLKNAFIEYFNIS